MLDVDTGSDKLRALLGHGSQEPLTLPIDKRDLIEIDDALQVVVSSMGLFPGSSQFADPQPN
jgi:hypothetical protein